MLKYILAVLLILLAWVAWFFVEVIPIWAPIVFTVVVVGVLVGLFVARRLRARRAAKELEKALAAQAEDHRRGARPDLQAEIAAMKTEFDKAVGSLRTSRLGRGTDALYALPWHVIIGPPGAGKSTALRNSGLQFPYLSSKGGGVRGLGGTRNCDWWLTNEGVLLDTAGRWATEDEDRDEWLAFLDMVKKYRPRKPLNGVLVAVSASELAAARDDEVTAMATQIRRRVDELADRLQLSLPVYVLFTKCDLVPGFVETFGDLSRDERGQIWGFTAPVTQPIGEPGNYFTTRFDEMTTSVEQRSTKRMSEERRIDHRERVYAFPQQFQALRKHLADFVSQVFQENQFRESPKMRGVYFTSGTQEGRPIDLVMNRMAEAFGIRSELPFEPVVEAKSYFLRDVFSNVIFQDSDLAMWSAAEQARERRGKLGAALAVLAVALLAAILPLVAWAQNRELLADAEESVDAVEPHMQGEQIMPIEALEKLRTQTERLHDYETDRPVTLGLGMYEGDAVYPSMRGLYMHVLRRNVLQPIVTDDTRAMNAFGREYESIPDARPTPEQQREFYDTLKSHLLLTRPTEPNQPPLEGELKTWLSDRVSAQWSDRARVEEDDEQSQTAILENTDFYLSLLSEDPELAFERDETAVRLTRNALNRAPFGAVALERIIALYEDADMDLRLRSLIGTQIASMRAEVDLPDGTRTEAVVRGAFTRRAWDERRPGCTGEVCSIKQMLETPDSGVLGESWVLGREVVTGGDAVAEEMVRLKSRYLRAYIEEWQQFIRALRVRSPEGNEQSLADLQDLTRGEPPVLGRYIARVAWNTNLCPPPPPAETEGQAAQRGILDIVEQRMRRSEAGRIILQVAGAGGTEPEQDLDERLLFCGTVGEPPGPVDHKDDVSDAFRGFNGFAVPEQQLAEGEEPPPMGLDVYQEQLRSVRDALQTYMDTPEDPEALLNALQEARTRVRALIEEQEVGWRPRFEAILWPPIDGSGDSSTRGLAMGAGRSWCAEVYRPWHRNLRNRYPFNPDGLDVPLADFADFYKPEGGTLWTFYDEVLASMIERDGDQFQFSRQLGRQGHFRPETLRHLSRAQEVSNAFFPPGTEDPAVEVDVRIRPTPEVEQIRFSIGEAEIEYHNGPEEWNRMTWPGETPEAGAFIEVRGSGLHERIEQDGEWGLYRILERGSVTEYQPGSSVFQVTWRLRTHEIDIKIDFRPVRGESPFFGVRGRNRDGRLMQPTRADQVTTPREIVTRARLCNIQS